MAAPRLVYVFEDAKGAKAQVVAYMAAVSTAVQMQQNSNSLVPLLEGMTSGVIRGASAVFPLTLPGTVRTDPLPGSDVEEGGRFIFGTAGGYSTAMRIPTFLESLVAADSRQIQVGVTAVADFITYMLTGNGTDPDPTDYRGEDIVNLLSALEAFQRSRRLK